MFDIIAPRYDDFTRRFSFGMDARWKAYVMAIVGRSKLPRGYALDLACGTGDFSFAIAAMARHDGVVGIDTSSQMLRKARERKVRIAAAAGARSEDAAVHPSGAVVAPQTTGAATVPFPPGAAMATPDAGMPRLPDFVQGDITHLPSSRNRAALATAGYAFRNVPEYRVALRQVAAAVAPDGMLVTLDFYLPAGRIFRYFFLGYLRLAGMLIGWCWHRSPATYEYIAHSIRHFVTARQFSADLDAAGFRVEQVKLWLRGGIAVHVSRKHSGVPSHPANA
jgi:demethylmenaquinone methyltransferase/2-methoxy-6-polyprenyl-1,4-benzoquinol methylase